MRKNILFSFCFLFIIIAISSLAATSVYAGDGELALSHGLYVLAEDSSMAMAGMKGNKISFEAEDFARAMNLKNVGSITVTEVPPVADGELLVGSTVVNSGQTVSASSIGLMSYSAKAETSAISYFKFKIDDSAYEIKCNLYLLDKANYAPTLNNATEASLNVSTHENIKLYGSLSAYDPDGDEIIIEVVSYPESGLLEITDKASGSYTYTPSDNYTGKDSFTYVARDKYGNYSASKTVNLTVNKRSTSVAYTDMKSSPFYNAAIDATEEGIMSGVQIGDNTYFYPDRAVSRIDFLVMAMNSIGIKDVADSSKTVFYDDSEIPGYMKGYVSAAYELGYIEGDFKGGERVFRPNDEITRAEAAVMICNMIDAATPTVSPVFEDSDDIPEFAETAVCALNYMGILDAEDGNISARDSLCRGEAAKLLIGAMKNAQ